MRRQSTSPTDEVSLYQATAPKQMQMVSGCEGWNFLFRWQENSEWKKSWLRLAKTRQRQQINFPSWGVVTTTVFLIFLNFIQLSETFVLTPSRNMAKVPLRCTKPKHLSIYSKSTWKSFYDGSNKLDDGLSFRECGYSSSVLFSCAAPSKPTMTLADTKMFVSHLKHDLAVSPATSTWPALPTRPTFTEYSDSKNMNNMDYSRFQYHRNRGVLGFRVLEEADSDIFPFFYHSSASSTATSLHASSKSVSADSSCTDHLQNKQETEQNQLKWQSISSWSPNTSRRRDGSNLSKSTFAVEVGKLSVVQLKQALVQRGLPRSGNKAVLQQRLIDWSSSQSEQDQVRQQEQAVRDGFLNFNDKDGVDEESQSERRESLTESTLQDETDSTWISTGDQKDGESENVKTVDSLAEWTRTVDLQPLLQRRKAIYRELERGKGADKAGANKKNPVSSLMTKEEYISVLKKVFDESSRSRYSNYEVKKMYAAAKEADQIGDRLLSKRILNELKDVTPRDARIFRRLARMEKEEGNLANARKILNEGLELDPHNAYLWHGLGQIAPSDNEAVELYQKAIDCDPSLPMPYHALGTLQHTKGRIASAMKTFKKGLEYCPSNHRLHHALGDIYREAKMLGMATKCYRKALKYGPLVSHGFVYNALAYVAYEEGEVDQCRLWLRKAVALNDGRNANGWVSLARMEEAEGNIVAARRICLRGIAKYERTLLNRSSVKVRKTSLNGASKTASEVRDKLMTRVPVYRSGDRFFNLYRNWARLEEKYGTVDSVSEVYERAYLAFPKQWKLMVDWANYHSRLNMYERAVELFSIACSQSAGQHGDPYRCFAEYEMSRGNYEKAQEILLRGAVEFSQAAGTDGRDRNGMVELYYVWGVCEWHLGNYARAETLFDHALRSLGEERVQLKSVILYAKAQLYYHQDEPLLSQNCIGLCLKENAMPAGMKSKIWDLWACVASEMNNEKLSLRCEIQAERARSKEVSNDAENLHDVVSSAAATSSASNSIQGRPEMQHLMRRDPWHLKVFGASGKQRATSYETVRLPISLQEQDLT